MKYTIGQVTKPIAAYVASLAAICAVLVASPAFLGLLPAWVALVVSVLAAGAPSLAVFRTPQDSTPEQVGNIIKDIAPAIAEGVANVSADNVRDKVDEVVNSIPLPAPAKDVVNAINDAAHGMAKRAIRDVVSTATRW